MGVSGADDPGLLIVGASHAGTQLASSLRERNFQGPITLVGAESQLPYQRPPLSKDFLLGKVNAAAIALRTQEFFDRQQVRLVGGERILKVEMRSDGSGTAWSDTGQERPFTRLALTVGARPRKLAIAGADLPGVLYLRDAQQARRLKAGIEAARRILVVGGGFIGLEVAATARRLDREVTVVLADDRVMRRSVGEKTSAFFREAHERRGVVVHTSAVPSRILGSADAGTEGVELSDGRRFPADLVVVGIGTEPRLELAGALGLELNNGIVTDENGLTSDGRTVAAGDCVSYPMPAPHLYGREHLRFESVHAANEQAKAAAATLVGEWSPFTSIPWFWSNQFDLKLQIAGLSQRATESVVRGDPNSERFSVLYFHDELLVAAESVNRPADFAAVRSALSSGLTLNPGDASDTAIPLKSLLYKLPVGRGT